MEHKIAASVEWPVVDTKLRLVDASATYSASVDFAAASFAFDSSEDCTAVGKCVDAAVQCAVDDVATVAFAGDAAMRIIANDVAIVHVGMLDDAFAVVAVLIAAGVGAVEHVDVADDGLAWPVVAEPVVVVVLDVAVAFVLLDYTVETEFEWMQGLRWYQLSVSLKFAQRLLMEHVAS